MVNSDAMIEVQERRGFSGVKEAVKLRRFIKELSHEEDIPLQGAKGQRLDGILDNAEQILSALQEKHRDWIEQKRQLFADYLSQVKPEVMEEAYRGGLATAIIQEFRTYGRVSREETVKLDDPEYLRKVITGYTVDFLRSLHLSQRMGINPNTALNVARLSYRYNPTKLIQLIRDPEFEGLTQSTYEHAALHYKNPDLFLRGFIKAVAELKAKPEFEGLTQSTYEYAALHNPKNPDLFLRGFIKAVAELKAKPEFEGLTQSTYEHAALHNPKNPDLFLRGFIKAVAQLAEKYPDISKSTITLAALYFPRKPEEYIEKVKAGKAPAEISEGGLESIVPVEPYIAKTGEASLPSQSKDE